MIAEVSKSVAVEAVKEGKRLKRVYQREYDSAASRLAKLAKIEAGVVSRRISKVKPKKKDQRIRISRPRKIAVHRTDLVHGNSGRSEY